MCYSLFSDRVIKYEGIWFIHCKGLTLFESAAYFIDPRGEIYKLHSGM